jgi:hypothetical protein
MASFILFSSLLSHLSYFSFCCLHTFFPRYHMFCYVSLFSSFQPLSFFTLSSNFSVPFSLSVGKNVLFVILPLNFIPSHHHCFIACALSFFTTFRTVCIVISLNFLPFSLFHLFTCFDFFVFNIYLPFVS